MNLQAALIILRGCAVNQCFYCSDFTLFPRLTTYLAMHSVFLIVHFFSSVFQCAFVRSSFIPSFVPSFVRSFLHSFLPSSFLPTISLVVFRPSGVDLELSNRELKISMETGFGFIKLPYIP